MKHCKTLKLFTFYLIWQPLEVDEYFMKNLINSPSWKNANQPVYSIILLCLIHVVFFMCASKLLVILVSLSGKTLRLNKIHKKWFSYAAIKIQNTQRGPLISMYFVKSHFPHKVCPTICIAAKSLQSTCSQVGWH